jgi:PAS domain S-box-containing protein
MRSGMFWVYIPILRWRSIVFLLVKYADSGFSYLFKYRLSKFFSHFEIKTVKLHGEKQIMNTGLPLTDAAGDQQAVGATFTSTQLNKMFDQLPVAFYTCDLQGCITYFNDAAAALWGRQPTIGKDMWCGSWKIFYPNGDSMPLHECPMAICLKEGRVVSGAEIRIERPDQSIRDLLVYPSPLYDEKNRRIGAQNTLIDVTDQRKYESRQGRLAGIIESSDDAIVSKDLNGIITSWNAAATRLFGYTADEVIGKSIKILIPADRHSEEDEILAKISKGQQVRHYEASRLHKSGRKLKISLTVSPLKNLKGKIIGASKIARDVTEQVAIRKELRRYTRELELMNKQKDEFMSLASHELKTPLTSAKAYIQLLTRMVGPEHSGHNFIGRAISSINRLENLINDLLDVSKIKEGKLTYNAETIRFNEVLVNSIENIQQLTTSHTLLLLGTEDVFVRGDRIRLEQVLNNLLTNAVKYSPDAKHVEVSSHAKDDRLIVSVKDFGIGIPEESIKRLSERYFRLDNDSMRFPGLGIGLFVSSEILKRHEGTMWIESEVGKGSTFYFDLPLCPPPY